MLCPKCQREINDDSVFCSYCGRKLVREKIRRRSNGTGTVYKQGSSYVAERMVGYKEDGKRNIIRKKGFRTKTEAYAYLKQDITVKSPTLREVYEGYTATTNVTKGTRAARSSFIKVVSPLMNRKFSELTLDDYQVCIDKATPVMGAKAKTLLSSMYKYAIPRNYVPNDRNVASFIKTKPQTKNKKPGFSPEELETIRQNIGKVKYADYIYCHCYLGFRPTAFLSLGKHNYFGDHFVAGIKTKAGIDRIVTISPKIRPIIDSLSHKEFFFDHNGSQMKGDTYRDVFKKALREMGIEIENRTPHSCRHTFATLIKNVDAPNADKLAIIGHANESQLMDYQDVRIEELRRITDNM